VKDKLKESFAKARAEEFKKFIAAKPQGAIYLRITGYEDDYGQPMFDPEVGAYVRKWAQFACLDLKKAVELFGPDTWGGNNMFETLHFLIIYDAIGEFSAQFDEWPMEKCIQAVVKLVAEGEHRAGT